MRSKHRPCLYSRSSPMCHTNVVSVAPLTFIVHAICTKLHITLNPPFLPYEPFQDPLIPRQLRLLITRRPESAAPIYHVKSPLLTSPSLITNIARCPPLSHQLFTVHAITPDCWKSNGASLMPRRLGSAIRGSFLYSVRIAAVSLPCLHGHLHGSLSTLSSDSLHCLPAIVRKVIHDIVRMPR